MSAAKNKYLKPSAKFESRIELAGSFRKLPAGINIGNTSFNQVIEVMIKIRRKNPIRNYIRGITTGKNKTLSRDVFDRRFGASPEDIELVVDFARQHDLTVIQTSISRRCVILMGSVQKFNDAFQVNLADFVAQNGITDRGRTGAIHIPEILKDIRMGVFGLDNRPQARPMFHLLKNEGELVHPRVVSVSYNPDTVTKAYKYPRDVNSNG